MVSFTTLLGYLYSSKKRIIIFTSIVFFALSVFYYADPFKVFTNEKPIQIANYRSESLSLVVLGVKVDGSLYQPTSLTFTLSDEVEPHTFLHYLTLSPEAAGSIKAGKNKREVIFEFSEDLAKDTIYVINISTGLKSIGGKPLLTPYENWFRTKSEDARLEFVENNFYGRVFTFPSNAPVQIKLDRNRYSDRDIQFSGDETVKLYRSTQADLLNFLVYKEIIDPKYPESSYKEHQYVRKLVDHKETEFIKEYSREANKDGYTINEKLEPGIYYLEAINEGGPVASAFAVVSSLGMILRQDDKAVTLKAYDLQTGRSTGLTADVGLYSLKDAPVLLKSSRFENEVAEIPLAFSNTLDVVVGRMGTEPVFIPVKVPDSTADIRVSSDLEKTYKLFLYTDRPIYKPNDTINFRGMVRVDSDGLYKIPPANTPIYIQLDETSTNSSFSTIVYTNAQGLFWGNLKAPVDDPNNLYDSQHELFASANPPGGKYYYSAAGANFEIFSYIKPEFGIEASVGKPEYTGNEKLTFKVSAKTFIGQPLKGEKVEYKFYSDNFYEAEKAVYNSNFNITSVGGMCGGGFWEEYYGSELPGGGTVTLNDQGEAIVEYSLVQDKLLSQTITMVAKKTDKNNNDIVSAAKTIVHASDINIFFTPSTTNYKPGETVVAPFYAETQTGEKIVNQDMKYTFSVISYNAGNSREEIVREGIVKTDANGAGIVSFTVPHDITTSSRYITIETMDKHGNKSRAQKSIYVVAQQTDYDEYYPDDSYGTILKVVSPKNSFIVGDTIILQVESPQELDTLMTLERGRVYSPQSVHLVKGKNTINIPVDVRLSPSVTVVFTFFMNGKYYTEGLSLNIPAMHKVLSMNISPNKSAYKPGETADIRITTHDSNGNPVAADVSLGVIDKAIFALRKSATPPVHSTWYAYRSRQTNASSSLNRVGVYDWGGRGGGGGGGGGVGGDGKQVDTLYWNPEIKTNSDGWATVQVPLGNTQTTWKALGIGSTIESQVGQADTEFVVAN